MLQSELTKDGTLDSAIMGQLCNVFERGMGKLFI